MSIRRARQIILDPPLRSLRYYLPHTFPRRTGTGTAKPPALAHPELRIKPFLGRCEAGSAAVVFAPTEAGEVVARRVEAFAC